MRRIKSLIAAIQNGSEDDKFSEIYNKQIISDQKERYLKLLSQHLKLFGNKEAIVVSSPGRTELGGNHTDHNLGNVLAGSVELDTVCVISKNTHSKVSFYSEGYEPIMLDSFDLSMKKEEKDTTKSLLRGILFRFNDLKYKIGGFNCNMNSRVLPGSGLSSSASVEVMIGTALSELFNDGMVNDIEVAQIGQFAENNYFGKACGLMDQLACAAGGVVGIDFKNPANPLIKPIKINFSKNGYKLIMTNVHSSHADLSDEYSAMPIEMKAVAKILGATVCREIKFNQLIENSQKIRKTCGDRALLRAFHFVQENERAVLQLKALENEKIKDYLLLVQESGNSSFKYLQNIYVNTQPKKQAISVGLAFTESFLKQIDPQSPCACRIQGGGFAGTIQAYIPNNKTSPYIKLMEKLFGKGSCFELAIRNKPACRLF